MSALYVLRHCITQLNLENKYTGSLNVSIANKEIDISNLQGVDADKEFIIISSPLARCIQTARQLNICLSKQFKIEMDNRISERDMGIWQGKPKCDVASAHPDYFRKGKFIPQLTPIGGEAFSCFSKRILLFQLDLLQVLKKDSVILCTHNQVLKLLLTTLFNEPISLTVEKKFLNGKLEKWL